MSSDTFGLIWKCSSFTDAVFIRGFGERGPRAQRVQEMGEFGHSLTWTFFVLCYKQKDLWAPFHWVELVVTLTYSTQKNLGKVGKKSKYFMGGRLISISCFTFHIIKFAPLLWELRHIGTGMPAKITSVWGGGINLTNTAPMYRHAVTGREQQFCQMLRRTVVTSSWCAQGL